MIDNLKITCEFDGNQYGYEALRAKFHEQKNMVMLTAIPEFDDMSEIPVALGANSARVLAYALLHWADVIDENENCEV